MSSSKKSNTRTLALIQLLITLVTFIMGIVFVTRSGFGFSFTHAGIIGTIYIIAFVAVIVVAILQIVYHASGVSMAAGIVGLLTFIPFVSIAAFVLNLIVVIRGR